MNPDNSFELQYQLDPSGTVADIMAHAYIKTDLEISDFQTDKTILDIGGGPKSLLLSTIGFKSGTIIDPVDYPAHINGLDGLLKSKNVTFRALYLEDLINSPADFDEVWCYNVIPHTSTPEKFLLSLINKVKDGGIIRLMEPMHKPYEFHPTEVTSKLVDIIRENSYEILKDTIVNHNGEGGFVNNHLVLIARMKKVHVERPKLKIHIYGLPHTLTVRDDPRMMTCAYTTKIWLLCKKFMEEGHEVIHYGVEGSVVPCTENVGYIPYELWEKHYANRDIKSFHVADINSEIYLYAGKHIVEEIHKRIKDPSNEVVLASFGFWSPELLNINKAALIEFGIGYEAIFTNYKVFESYAWMHTVYGLQKTNIDFKGWYDAAVPGYVDPEEFEFNEFPEDYLLFVGRIIDTKGVYVAAQLAKKCGYKLKIAGNGDTSWINTPEYENVIEYVGIAGVEEKKKLFKNALATLCMTHYIEPFANVHMESLMSGTPVIATDWGVYTESLPHGEVGFRVRTWEDYIYAIEHIKEIDRKKCREWAYSTWTLDAVYPKFLSFFTKCASHFTSKDNWYFKQDNYSQYISNYRQNFEDHMKVHIMMILNDKHINKGIEALTSYNHFHENFDITIIDCGLGDDNKTKLESLKGFKRFIKNEYNSIYLAKTIYINEIANSGKLLVMDADILFLDKIDNFFFFSDNEILHIVDDFATMQQQYEFNKTINESENVYQQQYFDHFPNLKDYKDLLTYNAGFFAIDLDNSKSKLFLNKLSEITKQVDKTEILWPCEQGILNYLIFSDNVKLKQFEKYYNSSAYNGMLIEQKDPKVKVFHYHTEETKKAYLDMLNKI